MSEELKATCRGCGKILTGKPYCNGGDAYDSNTMERAKVNHYGGYVCSESCDRKVSEELEGSMPGCTPSKSLSSFARKSISDNWQGV